MDIKNKIAVFAPEIHEPFIEGVQKAAWRIVNEIASSDIDVFLYTQKSYGTDVASVHKQIHISYVFQTGKVRIVKYFRWMVHAFSLARDIANLHVSRLLVFSLDWPFIPVLAVLCFFNKTSIRIIMFSTREVGSVGKFFLKLFGNRIETYFVSSLRVKEKLVALGVDDTRVVFLPVHFTKSIGTEVKRIERNKKSVLYLSSAEKEAGIETMLGAAKLLPDFTFILAIRDFGDSQIGCYHGLMQTIVSRNLTNIIVKQNLTNVRDELSAAGVVVLPPLTEDYSMALPLVLLEAFEASTPVITSNLPIFDFYKTSGYIQTFDTEDTLVRTLKVFASSDIGCIMGERAHNFVLTMMKAKEAAQVYIK